MRQEPEAARGQHAEAGLFALLWRYQPLFAALLLVQAGILLTTDHSESRNLAAHHGLLVLYAVYSVVLSLSLRTRNWPAERLRIAWGLRAVADVTVALLLMYTSSGADSAFFFWVLAALVWYGFGPPSLPLLFSRALAVIGVLALWALDPHPMLPGPILGAHPVMLLVLAVGVSFLQHLLGRERTEVESLIADLRAERSALQRNYLATARALASALEARDGTTGSHADRSERLARRLHARVCGHEASLGIAIGFLLHDVGKVGIPDAILQKPGSLTSEELEIMKRHTLIGFEITADLDFLDEGRQVILSHHERWDGNGYPQGLTGREIPLAARVFSAVDAYDAMTSDRPYRAALSDAEALGELRLNAGTQFDPEVVAALDELLSAGTDEPEPLPANSNGAGRAGPPLVNPELVAARSRRSSVV